MVINNSTETSSPPTASSSSSRSSSRKRRRRRTRTDEEDTTTIDHRPSPPPSSLDRTQTSDPLHPPFLLNSRSHYHPNYPISTVMNQVSSQNITSTALNAIKSSIPINLKPPPLTSPTSIKFESTSIVGTLTSSIDPPLPTSSGPPAQPSLTNDFPHSPRSLTSSSIKPSHSPILSPSTS